MVVGGCPYVSSFCLWLSMVVYGCLLSFMVVYGRVYGRVYGHKSV
jgi:hypothetical protein